MQNGLGCEVVEDYLRDSLGLSVSFEPWVLPDEVPLFLRSGITYALGRVLGVNFVAVFPPQELSLPQLKRLQGQLVKYTSLPVVLVSGSILPRQRRALVGQRIAFIVPEKQVFLPFLAFAADSTGEQQVRVEGKLTARAQGVLAAVIGNPKARSAQALVEITTMSPSSVSRAVAELARRGLVDRSKVGRSVIVQPAFDDAQLIRRAALLLASPVDKTVFVTKTGALESLPDSGQSALSRRTLLSGPRIEQKAIYKEQYRSLDVTEIIEGELEDDQTIELQIWNYPPLVSGQDQIDKVSLAASLAGLGDERINSQLDTLFDEGNLWD